MVRICPHQCVQLAVSDVWLGYVLNTVSSGLCLMYGRICSHQCVQLAVSDVWLGYVPTSVFSWLCLMYG